MQYIGLLTDEQKRAGLFVTQDEDFIYLWYGRDGTPQQIAVFLYETARVKEIRNKAEEFIEGKEKAMMDEETRAHIKDLEEHSRFPTGIGRIERGECEAGGLNPMACMFCSYGHMLECHYPYTCEEVECSHYQQEIEAEEDYYPRGEE